MKLILSALLGLFLAVTVSASPFKVAPQVTEQRPAVCAKGSAYWCQSLRNAKECGAMKHCIQAVWEKHVYPVDNDSICKICLDMVGQARDQLRSNETQEDLKAVFEGTCQLIRIKKARQECDKLADDFVPELVEALSSQMNPQAVCSVAGLCNNAAIDKELTKVSADAAVLAPKKNMLTCNQCGKVSKFIANKFQKTDRDVVLENMLAVCGRLSSFSDGCSNIILSYFNEIYDHLKGNLNKDSLCHMSGVCSDLYHQHSEQVGDDQEEASDESDEDDDSDENTDVVFQKGDDIPCDFCKQLVLHLRDVLTANTTEAEFKHMLEGICKQTKSFKAECLSITDQYFDVIFYYLNSLDPEGACFLIGVCPKGLTTAPAQAPSMPLLPVQTIQSIEKKKVLGADEPVFSAQQIQNFQLPIDELMFGGQQMEFQTVKRDTQYCALCEYFLHFMQEALATPKNEEKIKRAVSESCQHLPQTIIGQCQSFVSQYGDALIALLIQDIDPASVCPRLNVCERIYTNGQCPLCLFAFQEAENLIKDNRTEANIQNQLNALCEHLPSQLKDECTEFIRDNSKALIDSLIQKYSPEKACIKIHMCTPQEEMYIYALGSKRTSMDIETNEIEGSSFNDKETEIEISTPECLLCEQLIREVEKKAASNKSKEHVEEVLEHACESLPKANLREACITAVKKNSEFVINAIIKNVTPKEICVVLAFCIAENKPEPAGKNDPQCVLCELIMEHLEKELANKKNIEDIEKTVLNICTKLPNTVSKECASFVRQYATLIINLATKLPPREICTEISLCTRVEEQVVAAYEAPKEEVLECAVCHAAAEALSNIIKESDSNDRVVMGQKTCNALPPKYADRCMKFMGIYFESLHNLLGRNEDAVNICEKVGMCFKNEASVTFSDNAMTRPETKKEQLLGASKCTYGPSYWCHNDNNMNECNAHEYCLKKFKAVKVILT